LGGCFCPYGVKIVPSIIGLLLTPIALAVWVCDDGTYNGGLILQTNSYTLSDVELLVRTLQANFNLTAWIRFEKGAPIIYIPKSELPKLRAIISPHMPARMLYKPLRPN
jgi:hypothetical protein